MVVAYSFSPLSSWQEAWHYAGKYSAGGGAENSVSSSSGSRRLCATLGIGWAYMTSRSFSVPRSEPWLFDANPYH